MAKRVSKSQIGKTMVGRILSFERLRGYGFIRTSTGEDIFLSSYDVPNCVWRRICVGDYVEFVVGNRSGNSYPVVATHTTVTKKMPKYLSIMMPNQEELEVRHICQYGKDSLLKGGYGELYPDYPAESFDYVFVKTSRRSFTFSRPGSPIVFDGETDIDSFYHHLTDVLMKYDIERDYGAIFG